MVPVGGASIWLVVLSVLLLGCASKPAVDTAKAVANAPGLASPGEGETNTAPTTGRSVDGTPVDIQTLLTERAQFADYSEADRCLRTSDYDRVEVVSGDYLVFYDYSGTTWLNKIKKTCAGLRPGVMLHLGVRKRQICAEGMFEGVNHFAGGFNSVTGHCFLGVFHRVTKDQVEALKATLGVD